MPQRFQVPKYLVDKLRRFLQDYEEANELIDEKESPDIFLAEMLADALVTYNTIEPSGPGLSIVFETLSPESGLLIVNEAAARVLTSVSIRMQRNMLEYVDGNVRLQINDKWQFYNNTIQRLRGGDAGTGLGFAQMVKERKLKQNCDQAWGIVHSEFFDGYRYGGEGYVTVVM